MAHSKKHITDFIQPDSIMEVVKYRIRSGEFVGMRIMTHSNFKNMEKQKGFRYQEFQKGFSQY